jgi:hypothetical protein
MTQWRNETIQIMEHELQLESDNPIASAKDLDCEMKSIT